MNTLPEKLFFFCGKPFIEPFFNFFEIAEVQLCKRVSHWCKEVIVRCRQVKVLQRGWKDVPSKRFQGVFRQFWLWHGALSCNKNTFPCLLAHSSHFFINVWFKLIIIDDSVVWVGSSSSNACTFIFHIEIATFKLPKPCLMCSNWWNVFTTMILPANDDSPLPFSFD